MEITAVETVHLGPDSVQPALLFVRVTTSEGVVGLGETYYTPATVSAAIHEWLAPNLLTRSDLRIEQWWTQSYREMARRGPGGAEMRALSAVDIALWDAYAQTLGKPLFEVLGGGRGTRPSLPVYNTCGGRQYARGGKVGRGTSSGQDDLWRALNEPGELAVDLHAAGFGGMKIWPFDRFADRTDGLHISGAELETGAAVLADIRAMAPSDFDIMIDCHGFWAEPAAERILRAVEPFAPLWVEDLVLADNLAPLMRLRQATSVPIAVSEYLLSRWQYRAVLEQGAASYVHLDPSWCGGITESRHIVSLASSFGIPCAMHDATGPVNMLAGMHVGAAMGNVVYQEVLRSFLTEVYPTLVDASFLPIDGRVELPGRPGIGAALDESLLSAPGTTVRVSR